MGSNGTPKVGDKILIRDGNLIGRPWITQSMRPYLGTVRTVSYVSQNGRMFWIEGLDGYRWNTNIDIECFIDEPELEPPDDTELCDFIGF